MNHHRSQPSDPRPTPGPAAAPADPGERLWPGERPFTDFGQWGYGRLDLRVFDDGNTIWCDTTGRPHRPRDMTPEHRANVIAFLETNAPYFHLMTIRRRLIEVCSDLADGDLDPHDLERVQTLVDLDPVSWITATSIARALNDYC